MAEYTLTGPDVSSDSSSDDDDNSSSSDCSTDSSEDEKLETVKFGNDKFSLPQGLCDKEELFREFFSAETFNALSDSQKQHLSTFLPTFPENDELEKSLTLEMLFNGEQFRFSSPLNNFFQQLKAGHFNPDISKMRNMIKNAERREARLRYQRYRTQLKQEVIASRDQLLKSLQGAPPGYSNHNNTPQNYPTTPSYVSPIAFRTKRRYFQHLSVIRRQVNQDDVSSDENYPDMSKNLKKPRKTDYVHSLTDKNDILTNISDIHATITDPICDYLRSVTETSKTAKTNAKVPNFDAVNSTYDPLEDIIGHINMEERYKTLLCKHKRSRILLRRRNLIKKGLKSDGLKLKTEKTSETDSDKDNRLENMTSEDLELNTMGLSLTDIIQRTKLYPVKNDNAGISSSGKNDGTSPGKGKISPTKTQKPNISTGKAISGGKNKNTNVKTPDVKTQAKVVASHGKQPGNYVKQQNLLTKSTAMARQHQSLIKSPIVTSGKNTNAKNINNAKANVTAKKHVENSRNRSKSTDSSSTLSAEEARSIENAKIERLLSQYAQSKLNESNQQKDGSNGGKYDTNKRRNKQTVQVQQQQQINVDRSIKQDNNDVINSYITSTSNSTNNINNVNVNITSSIGSSISSSDLHKKSLVYEFDYDEENNIDVESEPKISYSRSLSSKNVGLSVKSKAETSFNTTSTTSSDLLDDTIDIENAPLDIESAGIVVSSDGIKVDDAFNYQNVMKTGSFDPITGQFIEDIVLHDNKDVVEATDYIVNNELGDQSKITYEYDDATTTFEVDDGQFEITDALTGSFDENTITLHTDTQTVEQKVQNIDSFDFDVYTSTNKRKADGKGTSSSSSAKRTKKVTADDATVKSKSKAKKVPAVEAAKKPVAKPKISKLSANMSLLTGTVASNSSDDTVKYGVPPQNIEERVITTEQSLPVEVSSKTSITNTVTDKTTTINTSIAGESVLLSKDRTLSPKIANTTTQKAYLSDGRIVMVSDTTAKAEKTSNKQAALPKILISDTNQRFLISDGANNSKIFIADGTNQKILFNEHAPKIFIADNNQKFLIADNINAKNAEAYASKKAGGKPQQTAPNQTNQIRIISGVNLRLPHNFKLPQNLKIADGSVKVATGDNLSYKVTTDGKIHQDIKLLDTLKGAAQQNLKLTQNIVKLPATATNNIKMGQSNVKILQQNVVKPVTTANAAVKVNIAAAKPATNVLKIGMAKQPTSKDEAKLKVDQAKSSPVKANVAKTATNTLKQIQIQPGSNIKFVQPTTAIKVAAGLKPTMKTQNFKLQSNVKSTPLNLEGQSVTVEGQTLKINGQTVKLEGQTFKIGEQYFKISAQNVPGLKLDNPGLIPSTSVGNKDVNIATNKNTGNVKLVDANNMKLIEGMKLDHAIKIDATGKIIDTNNTTNVGTSSSSTNIKLSDANLKLLDQNIKVIDPTTVQPMSINTNIKIIEPNLNPNIKLIDNTTLANQNIKLIDNTSLANQNIKLLDNQNIKLVDQNMKLIDTSNVKIIDSQNIKLFQTPTLESSAVNLDNHVRIGDQIFKLSNQNFKIIDGQSIKLLENPPGLTTDTENTEKLRSLNQQMNILPGNILTISDNRFMSPTEHSTSNIDNIKHTNSTTNDLIASTASTLQTSLSFSTIATSSTMTHTPQLSFLRVSDGKLVVDNNVANSKITLDAIQAAQRATSSYQAKSNVATSLLNSQASLISQGITTLVSTSGQQYVIANTIPQKVSSNTSSSISNTNDVINVNRITSLSNNVAMHNSQDISSTTAITNISSSSNSYIVTNASTDLDAKKLQRTNTYNIVTSSSTSTDTLSKQYPNLQGVTAQNTVQMCQILPNTGENIKMFPRAASVAYQGVQLNQNFATAGKNVALNTKGIFLNPNSKVVSLKTFVQAPNILGQTPKGLVRFVPITPGKNMNVRLILQPKDAATAAAAANIQKSAALNVKTSGTNTVQIPIPVPVRTISSINVRAPTTTVMSIASTRTKPVASKKPITDTTVQKNIAKNIVNTQVRTLTTVAKPLNVVTTSKIANISPKLVLKPNLVAGKLPMIKTSVATGKHIAKAVQRNRIGKNLAFDAANNITVMIQPPDTELNAYKPGTQYPLQLQLQNSSLPQIVQFIPNTLGKDPVVETSSSLLENSTEITCTESELLHDANEFIENAEKTENMGMVDLPQISLSNFDDTLPQSVDDDCVQFISDFNTTQHDICETSGNNEYVDASVPQNELNQ